MEKNDILATMQKIIDDEKAFREKYPHYGKKIVEHEGQLHAYDPKEFEFNPFRGIMKNGN